MSGKKYPGKKMQIPSLWPSSTWEKYVQTILKELDYLAIWKPDEQLRLGDYGRLDKHYRWDYQGNLLDEYGIKITTRKHRKKAIELFDDEGSVKIDIVGKGKIPEIVNGGIRMNFEKKSEVAFVLINTLPISINNIPSVTKKIVELAQKNLWEPDYHVISNITSATKMIFISSKSANSTIHVEADAEVLKKQLGNAEIQLDLKSSKKTEYKFILNEGATPLYRLRHLRQYRGKFSLVKTTPWIF